MNVVTLDLGEVADEWQEAIDTLDPEAHDLPPTEDEAGEARGIIEQREQLCVDLGGTPVEPSTLRWLANHTGVTLIREDTFEDYAREFAEDIHGDIGELGSFIDWGRYADSVRQDYYDLEYDGHTWLRRA